MSTVTHFVETVYKSLQIWTVSLQSEIHIETQTKNNAVSIL